MLLIHPPICMKSKLAIVVAIKMNIPFLRTMTHFDALELLYLMYTNKQLSSIIIVIIIMMHGKCHHSCTTEATA